MLPLKHHLLKKLLLLVSKYKYYQTTKTVNKWDQSDIFSYGTNLKCRK